MVKTVVGSPVARVSTIHNTRIYYELKSDKVLKITQLGSMQKVNVLTYQEFNESIDGRESGVLPVSDFPTGCHKIEVDGSRVIYHINLAKPYVPMFLRKEVTHQPENYIIRVYGSKREIIKCQIEVDTGSMELHNVKITLQDGTRCVGLESRAERIYNRLEIPEHRLGAWSYWMRTVAVEEPHLLTIIESGESLATYTGEEG